MSPPRPHSRRRDRSQAEPEHSPRDHADLVVGVEFAEFDPGLRAAAVALQPPGALLMAVGWSDVPEDPHILELRHIPNLPAVDARRITELFAEAVDVGDCRGSAWEVLTRWDWGTSPSATAAAQAVQILVCRSVEAYDFDPVAVQAAVEHVRARVHAALDLELLEPRPARRPGPSRPALTAAAARRRLVDAGW